MFEGLWHAAGRDSVQGNFFQSLIQLAAANLKRFMGHDAAAQKLVHSGIIRLRNVPTVYMGIDISRLLHVLHEHRISPQLHIPLLELDYRSENVMK